MPIHAIASRWNNRAALLVLLLAIVTLLTPPLTAHAHGYIVRAIPEDQAQLDRAPARVQFWFSESLEPQFSRVTVYDPANAIIAEGGVSPVDESRLEARLPLNLPDGAYIVELRIAFASDGHVQIARQAFYVGTGGAPIGGTGIGDVPAPLEIVWRALLLTGFTLIVGTLTAYALVFVPAWGNPKYRAGLLPPRVLHRLDALLIAGLGIAVAGNLLALLQQSMVFFDADAGRVIAERLWEVVRTSTRFGDTWDLRMGLIALLIVLYAASVYVRREQPGLVRAFWTAAGWASALTFATMSIGSHAAGSLTLPWLAVISDWLHGAAVGVWLGGVLALTVVLPAALRPLSGEARRLALLAALRRFSPIAAACLFLVVATGIYNSTNWIAEADDLGTRYTLTLAAKIALVIALVAIGALHHVAARPERYTRWAAIGARVQGFLPTLRIESGLAGLTLIGAALLSATPVPQPTFAQPPAPTAVQTIGDLTAQVTLTPGGPGVNTYDITLTRDGQPVTGETVQTRLVSPARDWRGDWLPADDLGGGLYVAAGGEIDRPGDWWMLIAVGSDPAAVQRFAFAWPITIEAAVIEARPLTPLGAIALLLVVGAAINLLLPSLRRVIAIMDWSPAAVTVGVASTVATIAAIAVAVVIMGQVTAQYAADLEPPPQVVNAVLPDAASVERGAAAFAACGWDERPAFTELVRRLERVRDEELYRLVTAGSTTLPACANVSGSAAWDVVNYVRLSND